MPFDERSLSIAVVVLGLAVVILAAWLAILQRSEARLRHRLRRIFDSEGSGLDEVLDGVMKRLDQDGERLDALRNLHREVEALAQRSLHRIGVVRFNPFPDTGGDQSFAVALLDALGNGLVVSSLHSRTDTRVFAKPIVNGRSRYALSDEEQDAIRRALATGERS